MSFARPAVQIISRVTPEWITMVVRGEIDMATAPQFRHEMTDRLAHGSISTLHLDLSGVTFIDSSGLQAMLVVQRTAQLMGGELVITRMSPPVTRLLDLVGLRFQCPTASEDSDAMSSA